MKHSYKSRVNFSFLTTVVVIAIIITFPSVKNLYSATKDTYRIIENKFRIFNQMIQYVNEYYYDEVDLEKIWDGAFHGFMEKLDPHSVYIPPKKQEEIDEIFRGKFQGIGIEFDILDGYITVIAPVADSPSERAGLHPGDKIIEIDGEDAYGITKNEVMKTLRGPKGTSVDLTHVKDISLFTGHGGTGNLSVPGGDFQGGKNVLNIRRLNQLGTFKNGKFTSKPLTPRDGPNAALMFVVSGTLKPTGGSGAGLTGLTGSCVISPTLDVESGVGSTLTIPSFESNFSTSSPSPIIPEIDIKIESIAVTAATRKLRARWSPELAQDLNAYHSLDAEVELTQILSEQIALEIDREILNDLLTEAAGANYYWSRMPGKFVNKKTGNEATASSTLASGPQFTGTVREWYETLVETIIDVANEIHRKTLRGSANFIVCSPDIATIFEASVLYKPNYSLDGQGQVGNPMQLGAAPIGSLSNRFTVYKDPYFPRNKVLVGYKGGSYLETGYVYAPYVPLIVTPTIFQPEDFTPRKGVMTRYGKKMVRADFYGTVTVQDLNVI